MNDRAISSLQHRRRHPLLKLAKRSIRFASRVMLHASGLPLTLLFGLLPILLYLSGQEDDILGIPGQVAILTAGIAVAGGLGFWLALRALPPETYAELLISGRPEDEIFTTIARKARRICRAFTASSRRTSDLTELLLDKAQLWPDIDDETAPLVASSMRQVWYSLDPTDVAGAIGEIRTLLEKQDSLLCRVEAAKHRAATELGIHPRRLCDHIFHFSPAMYQAGLMKYLRTWEELEKTIAAIDDKGDVQRFCRQVEQNFWIERDIRWRQKLLGQVVDFDHLHPYVTAIASIHSSSGSLRAYLWGLHAAVAELVGEDEHESWDEETLSRAQDQLHFLYRKRRAHTGFDLHLLAIQLCTELKEQIKNEPHTVLTPEIIHSVVSVLTALKDGPAVPSPQVPAILADAPLRHRLQHLDHLPLIFSQAMAKSREKLAENFNELLDAWRKGVDGNVFIVTHGYSKMVRDIVGRSALAEEGDGDGQGKLRIFLLVTGEEDEEFDARRMKLELRRQVKRPNFRVAAGSMELLTGLVREGDRVLFLLGAECFDSEDQIVHPRTTIEHVRELNRQLLVRSQRTMTLLMVVAEAFKRLPSPLRESGFFTDHFERVAVYGREDDESLKVIIVTDKGTHPDSAKKFVKEHLATGS